jgi:LysM repeat protein
MLKLIRQTLLVMLIGVTAFSAAPLVLTAASYAYFQSSDVILPGVRIGSVEAGGLTIETAARAVETAYNIENELLLIAVPAADRSWPVSPAEFGIEVDAGASVAEAFKISRQGRAADRIAVMLETLRNGRLIKPVVRYDPSVAQKALVRWGDVVSRAPRRAGLELVGSRVFVEPASSGVTVDVGRTLDFLSGDYEAVLLENAWLPLFTVEISPDRENVDQVAAELEALLAEVPDIHAYDPVTDEHFTWNPDRSTVAEWVSIKDDGSRISIQLDPDRIRSYLAELNGYLGPERFLDKEAIVEAMLSSIGQSGGEVPLQIIAYYPTEYIVQPGDTLVSIGFKVHMPYWKLHELNPTLVTHGLSTGQKLEVPPRDDLLTLPVVPSKRIMISIRDQRMWVYEHGELKWENIISTGIPNSPTMPGVFQISSHYENAYASIWDLYMPHFMGIYDAVPGLTNGIHGLPVLSSGHRLWANVLGSPASYGCIILDLEAAEQLFNWAEEGVVVEILE